MAYRSLPEFDPSAQFLFTARVPIFGGVPRTAGEVFPPPPPEPGAARMYWRRLKQLYEKRMVTMVAPSAAPPTKPRKEKPHGRAKVQG
jgi:hypothetical protein